MASGLAVVGTPQPQVRQVLLELGQSDLLVPSGDAPALAAQLSQLADDRARVRRLGAAARQRAVAFYNWRRVVEDTMRAIDRLRAARYPPRGGA
jgi:glycosyltransferase involved in cell wall biosynthesis